MERFRLVGAVLLASTILTPLVARAADVDIGVLPAVSALNGKVEFGGGWADSDANDMNRDSDTLWYGKGSLAMPLGDRFGAQADFSVVNVFDETSLGIAGHIFERDPSSHLFGVAGGYVHSDFGSLLWGGAEAELYLGNMTLTGVAGLSHRELNAVPNSWNDALFSAQAAFYATDDLKLSVSASSIAKVETAGLGLEWQMSGFGLPLALTAQARMGEDNYKAATVGIELFFGGNEAGKSLIRRQREDDPGNLANGGGTGLDIFGGGILGSSLSDYCGDTEVPVYTGGHFQTCKDIF
jgi:hypothetical protein